MVLEEVGFWGVGKMKNVVILDGNGGESEFGVCVGFYLMS